MSLLHLLTTLHAAGVTSLALEPAANKVRWQGGVVSDELRQAVTAQKAELLALARDPLVTTPALLAELVRPRTRGTALHLQGWRKVRVGPTGQPLVDGAQWRLYHPTYGWTGSYLGLAAAADEAETLQGFTALHHAPMPPGGWRVRFGGLRGWWCTNGKGLGAWFPTRAEALAWAEAQAARCQPAAT